MIEYNGRLQAGEGRIGIVVSRFNESITRQLLAGARDCLIRHGVTDDAIEAVWVPGAWEIPVAVRALARSGRFSAVVALGAVIRPRLISIMWPEGCRAVSRASAWRPGCPPSSAC